MPSCVNLQPKCWLTPSLQSVSAADLDARLFKKKDLLKLAHLDAVEALLWKQDAPKRKEGASYSTVLKQAQRISWFPLRVYLPSSSLLSFVVASLSLETCAISAIVPLVSLWRRFHGAPPVFHPPSDRPFLPCQTRAFHREGFGMLLQRQPARGASNRLPNSCFSLPSCPLL